MKDLVLARYGIGLFKLAGHECGSAAPTCGKPPAFRPMLDPSTSSALAGRLSLPASAEAVQGTHVPRKGEAFPQVRRRSRTPLLTDASVIRTSLPHGVPLPFEKKAVTVA
jgi:hypothetical protein